jgi:hypothetical protein
MDRLLHRNASTGCALSFDDDIPTYASIRVVLKALNASTRASMTVVLL